MTKKELAEKLAEENDLSKAKSEEIITMIFDQIAQSLKNGQEVQIHGFGKFAVVKRQQRNGLNPQTREKIVIPASKSSKFKQAKQLKELINN